MWLVLMMNVSFGQESVDEPAQVSDSYMKSDAFQVGVEPLILSFGATSGLSLSSKNGVFVGLESAIFELMAIDYSVCQGMCCGIPVGWCVGYDRPNGAVDGLIDGGVSPDTTLMGL